MPVRMAKVWRDLLSATKEVRAEADDYKHWISSSYPATAAWRDEQHAASHCHVADSDRQL